MMGRLWRVIVELVLNGLVVATVGAEDELKALLDRVMAHDIKPAAGFTAKVIAPPGRMYDPLVMHLHGDAVWINDDGKEEGDKGNRLLSIDRQGKVSALVDTNKMLPISAGFGITPEEFGNFGGQIFALSQPKIGDKGGLENYVTQRIDPRTTMPSASSAPCPDWERRKSVGSV